MSNGNETPQQAVNERLAELEAKSEGKLQGLVDRVASFFWNGVKDTFIIAFTVLSQMSEQFLDNLIGKPVRVISRIFSESHKPIEDIKLSELFSREADPHVIVDRLFDATKSNDLVSWLFSAFQYITALVMLTIADSSVINEMSRQELNTKFRPSLIPLNNVINSIFRNPESVGRMKEIMSQYGFKDNDMDILINTSRQLLSNDILRDAFLRGKIDEAEFDKGLESLGISDENIKIIKSVLYRIPPVNDIITMAVREVFSPEIAEKFGQYEDYPQEVSQYGQQAGISDEWLRRYWAAHWALPSIRDGFEMLHRGVISQDELQMLLRAADVMPFWRSKLTAISYNPLTRVDVRRMYALGVLDEEGVTKAYKDLGYNDINAQLMTEFTVKYTTQSEKELTKTDIINLYKDHGIDTEEALKKLQAIGYTKDNADLLLYKADYEMYRSYKNDIIKYVESGYVAGKLSQGDVISKLGKLDLPSDQINYLINSWDTKRDNKVKTLTLDNLKAFFKSNIINTNELRSELKELGYNEQDVDRFVMLFSKER